MKIRLLIIFFFLASSTPTVRADKVIILRGIEAQALELALQSFKSNQHVKYEGKPIYGDLKHYRIELTRQARSFEIVFIPDQSPLKANEAGTGGGTAYGWDVTYTVSLDGKKILNEHFSK